MSYRLWQQRYGSDPSVVGSIFNLERQAIHRRGNHSARLLWRHAAQHSARFLSAAEHRTVRARAIPISTSTTRTGWQLIGRIQPGATPASIEAEMRVELKQWLRSHWGEMSANDRAKLPEQTLFLSPGGAGITSMREQYEHWLQILMMVTGFVLLIVCANVANLMLVRGMERRRQTALSMALGARASRVVRQALTESLLLSLSGGAAGLAIAFAGTRLILQFVFPALPGIRRRADRRVAFHAGAAVCLGHVAVDGRRLRHRSRMDGDARRSDRSASRRGPVDHSCGLAAEEGARGLSSGALAWSCYPRRGC